VNLSVEDLERIRDEAHAKNDCVTARKAQECIIRRGVIYAYLTPAPVAKTFEEYERGPRRVLHILVDGSQAVALTRWIEQTLGIKVVIE